MNYQVTVRHGKKNQRYHTVWVEAPDAVAALREAADQIPEEMVAKVDLVELRESPDLEKTRPFPEGL